MVTEQWAGDVFEQIKSIRVRTAVFWISLLFVQACLVGIYLLATGTRVTNVRYLIVYPFLWINLSLWVFLYVRPKSMSLRRGIVATAIAVVYFGVLVIIPDLIDQTTTSTESAFDLRIHWLIPGWGPFVGVDLGALSVGVTTFQAFGYGALAYLVALNVLHWSRGSFASVLGLVTCVGCTVPIIVPILGSLGGMGSAIATVTTGWYLDLGTVVFLVAVWLLYRGAMR